MRKAINKLDAEAILHSYHLKRTIPRIRALTLLTSTDMAIARSVIARKMKDIGSASLYRVLRELEKKRVVYKIFDLRGTAHYALCLFCPTGNKPSLYLNFNCLQCRKVYCLDGAALPQIKSPHEFKTVSFTMLITGTCPACRKKGLFEHTCHHK